MSFQAIRTGSGILSFHPCWCPSPFPFAFHISVFFHSLFFTCHWISFLFLLYDWCICTHQSTLQLLTFQVSFQAWDWLWYPLLWSQRRSRGAHEAEISFSNFFGVWTSDLAVWWPWTLPLDFFNIYVTTHPYQRRYVFTRLLHTSYILYGVPGVGLKKKCGRRKSGRTPDSCMVTNLHKTYNASFHSKKWVDGVHLHHYPDCLDLVSPENSFETIIKGARDRRSLLMKCHSSRSLFYAVGSMTEWSLRRPSLALSCAFKGFNQLNFGCGAKWIEGNI